jgi:predicted XRE-type DNA-binding protein
MNENMKSRRPPGSAKAARNVNDTTVIRSSGDVYADLGITLDAKDRLKNGIAREITTLIEARKLTQKDVASILGTDQAKVSNITRGRLSGFSVDRLVNFLIALGYDVDIHLSESRHNTGSVTVHPLHEAVG